MLRAAAAERSGRLPGRRRLSCLHGNKERAERRAEAPGPWLCPGSAGAEGTGRRWRGRAKPPHISTVSAGHGGASAGAGAGAAGPCSALRPVYSADPPGGQRRPEADGVCFPWRMWGRGGRRVPRVGGRARDAGVPGPAWSKQDDRFRGRAGGRRDGGGQTWSFRRRGSRCVVAALSAFWGREEPGGRCGGRAGPTVGCPERHAGPRGARSGERWYLWAAGARGACKRELPAGPANRRRGKVTGGRTSSGCLGSALIAPWKAMYLRCGTRGLQSSLACLKVSLQSRFPLPVCARFPWQNKRAE